MDGEESDLHVSAEVHVSEACEAAIRCWNGARELVRSDIEIFEALQITKSCRE